MGPRSLFAGTIITSMLIHAALGHLVVSVFAPRPIDPQKGTRSEFTLGSFTVPEVAAPEHLPNVNPTVSQSLPSEALISHGIPRSTIRSNEPERNVASPLAPNSQVAATQQPQIDALSETQVSSQALIQYPPSADLVNDLGLPRPIEPSPQSLPRARIALSEPEAFPAQKETVVPVSLEQSALDSDVASLASGASILVEPKTPHTTASIENSPEETSLSASPPSSTQLTGGIIGFGSPIAGISAQAVSAPVTNQILKSEVVPRLGAALSSSRTEQLPIDIPAAISMRLPSDQAEVVLAWSGDLTLDVSDKTISSATALSLPFSEDNGLRDELAENIGSVKCARVQTVYDPSTGTVQLTGHVRTDLDRKVLLDQISVELAGTIPVEDRLRRLGSPQCDVLARLAEMPLPQSVDQLTNPLVIGDNLQARTYRYIEDDAMTFDLVGADYDGWPYIDYYDDAGQVLHLLPNEFIDHFQLSAKTALVFGDGSANDPARGKFSLRVSPPFGEDIAVAMIANVPLFDEPRPTVELASVYLKELENRIVELRERNPRFRGEWIYIFVETFPK